MVVALGSSLVMAVISVPLPCLRSEPALSGGIAHSRHVFLVFGLVDQTIN